MDQQKYLSSYYLFTHKKTIPNLFMMMLALYFFSVPLDFFPLVNNFSISKLTIIAPLFFIIFYLNRIEIKFNIMILLSLIYYIYILTSYFYSVNQAYTLDRIVTISLYILLILFVNSIRFEYKEIIYIEKIYAYSLILIIGLLSLFSDPNVIPGRIVVSVNGVFQDPNYLSGYLIFPTIYFLSKINKRNWFFNFTMIALSFFIVLILGSRGGLIAIITSVATYLIIQSIVLKKIKLALGFSTFVFTLLFCLYKTGLMTSEFFQRFDPSFTLKDGGANRFYVWEYLISIFHQGNFVNQFFGNGAGTITLLNPLQKVAHNVWIENLLEIGYLGTFVYCIFILYFLITSLFKMKNFVYFSVLVGYIVMTFSMSLYSYKPLWNILILIIILYNYKMGIRRDKI